MTDSFILGNGANDSAVVQAQVSERTVTVAVLTYRRPADLNALLPMLLAQVNAVPAPHTAEVLVVDNDPNGRADSVAAHTAARLRYVVEATPGIAAARNRALTECAQSSLLVFIDDDERPSPSWLNELLKTYADTGAAAVAGPVVTDHRKEDLDPWLVAGGFLERRHRAGLKTGTTLDNAATNNLLLDLDEVRRLGLSFDVEFGLSGGEDTLFTRSLVSAGGRIVWCETASVNEQMRPERLNRRWMLQRAFSYGNTDARIAARLAGRRGARWKANAHSAFWGLARIGLGSAFTVSGRLMRSLARRAYGEQMVCRGFGLVIGALGVSHVRYHGKSSESST